MAQLLPGKGKDKMHVDSTYCAGPGMEPMPRFGVQYDRSAQLWRVIAYTAVFVPLLCLIVLAFLRPDFNRQQIPDWKPVLELAEATRARGDLIEARAMYSRAGRLAGRQDDWTGLVAAACGLHKIDKDAWPYSGSHGFLLRAMIAAEEKQSRLGMAKIARALVALGAHEMAAVVLARVRSDWPEKPETADVYKSDCW